MRAILFGTLLISTALLVVETARTDTPKQKDDPKVAPGDAPKILRLPTTKEVMAMKLRHSQGILEAIALNDLEKVQALSVELVKVSNKNEFLNAYKGPEYQFQTLTFLKAAEMIGKKAKQGNMDGVMVAYNDLTQSCLKCHQAMRDNLFRITKDIAAQ